MSTKAETVTRPKLQYKARTAGERTSLKIILESNEFKLTGEEGEFDNKKTIVISTVDKTFSFEEKGSTKNRDISLSVILNNDYRIKRTIKDVELDTYIAGYWPTVTSKGVKFGCQLVTFAHLDTINKAVDKMKKTLAEGEYEYI